MPGLRGDLVHWPAGEVNRRAHEAVPIPPLSLVDWIAQGQRQQIGTVTHRTVQVRYYQLWKNYTKVYFSFEEIHILLSSQQFTTGCISFSVDGGFSNWGSWGTCTVTCGGGTQVRTRSCSSPAPQYGGALCAGATSQSQACNTQVCISKSSILNYCFDFTQKLFIAVLRKRLPV